MMQASSEDNPALTIALELTGWPKHDNRGWIEDAADEYRRDLETDATAPRRNAVRDELAQLAIALRDASCFAAELSDHAKKALKGRGRLRTVIINEGFGHRKPAERGTVYRDGIAGALHLDALVDNQEGDLAYLLEWLAQQAIRGHNSIQRDRGGRATLATDEGSARYRLAQKAVRMASIFDQPVSSTEGGYIHRLTSAVAEYATHELTEGTKLLAAVRKAVRDAKPKSDFDDFEQG